MTLDAKGLISNRMNFISLYR